MRFDKSPIENRTVKRHEWPIEVDKYSENPYENADTPFEDISLNDVGTDVRIRSMRRSKNFIPNLRSTLTFKECNRSFFDCSGGKK